MSRELAARLSTVAPSATLAMAARAAMLRAEGHKVLSFSVGEPDFLPPGHVLEAAKGALAKDATHRYTPVSGTAELKAAICSATARDRGYTPSASELVISCGAKHALFNVALALYQPGDEVVIPAPYWVSYPEQVRMFGAEPVFVEGREEDGFRMRPEALAAALSPKTKAVILGTPSNPTGAAYGEEELRALLEVLRGHDCWIVLDEIYGDLTYDGFRHVSAAALAPELRERIIVIDGVSKTYAMTGWRIGWSIAPAALTKSLDLLQSQSTTNASAIAQAAAAAALLGPRDEVLSMRDTFARRRVRMVEGLRSLPGFSCQMPEGAFYAFPRVSGLFGKKAKGKVLQSDSDVADWFLDDAHVATVAGTPFGAPGYLRFSYACSEEVIDAGLEALRASIGRLEG